MRLLILFIVLSATFCGVSKLLEAGPNMGNVVAYECEGLSCSQAIKEYVETGSEILISKIQRNNLLPVDTVFLKSKKPIAYLNGKDYENELLVDDLSLARNDDHYFYDIPQVQIQVNSFDAQKLGFIKAFVDNFHKFKISEILIKREDFFEAELIFDKKNKTGRYRILLPVAYVYDHQIPYNLEVLADYLLDNDVLRKTILVSPKGKLVITRSESLVVSN